MKTYTHYANITIEMFPSPKNENNILVKDIINEHIVCSKHINYIKKIGLEFNTPYMVNVAFYTNERGYREADFMRIYSYVPTQTNQSQPQKPTAQAKAPSKTKPSWLR
jgi:hypothetical protein